MGGGTARVVVRRKVLESNDVLEIHPRIIPGGEFVPSSLIVARGTPKACR